MAGAAGATALAFATPALAATSTRIQTENANAGSNAWRLTNPAGDDLKPFGAYVLQDSVKAGEQVDIVVLADSAMAITATVFRLGWYGGTGGRLMRTLAATQVNATPPLRTNVVTGETGDTTAPAFSFTVPDSWLSGIYVIRLVNADGVDAHATFAVKDTRQCDIVFSQPILTYLAYTNTPTPTGKSLYDGQSGGPLTDRGTQRATEVSFDRPYRLDGAGDLFRFDHDLIMWFEKEGYDITYVTNLDIDRWPDTIKRGRINVVSGHDEYWTQRIMDAYLDARDSGIHIANLGANNAYWRVQVATSRDGRPKRRMICFKYADGDDPDEPTVLFKDTDTTMQNMWSVDFMDFMDFNNTYPPIVPTNTSHWFWAGAEVEDDQELDDCRIMGYEVDRRNFSVPLPPNVERTLLASSPFVGDEKGSNWAHSVLYRAPSGAWVFSGGTNSWGWGLIRDGFAHPAIQRATINLLSRMLADSDAPTPEPPSDGFAPFANAQAFVRQQYRDFLGREADAAGLDYWAGQAGDDGSGMVSVVDRFLRTNEFAPRFSIARLYLAAFGRIPDAGGYDFWNRRHLQEGMSIEAMATFFSSSDEFRATYGDPANREFVRLIYRNVFDRDPDGDGWDFWEGRLDGGLTKGQLLANFSQSPEGQTIYENRVLVVATYQGLLKRPPAGTEYQQWASRLDGGEPSTALIEALLTSSEYDARF